MSENKIQIFEDPQIRKKWNDDEDQWWFVVQDVIAFLTESPNPRDYWYRLKQRSAENEGVELSTFCRQLKFEAKDGKKYKYECANNEGLFRIIQSIPSPKAEPFKLWLAKLGKERIEEIEQPQKAIDRGKRYYSVKGYTQEWISDRTAGISSRNELTEYWQKSGVEGKEYAMLTNEIYSSTFGFDAARYKQIKGLKTKDSLRDNMTNIELVVTRFAEVASREIAESTNATGFDENKKAIEDAGEIIQKAVQSIEQQTGKPIASKENKKHLNTSEKTKQIIQEENKKKLLAEPSTKSNEGDYTGKNGLLAAMLKVPPPKKEEK
jgi:hypothetical protein